MAEIEHGEYTIRIDLKKAGIPITERDMGQKYWWVLMIKNEAKNCEGFLVLPQACTLEEARQITDYILPPDSKKLCLMCQDSKEDAEALQTVCVKAPAKEVMDKIDELMLECKVMPFGEGTVVTDRRIIHYNDENKI